MARRKAAGRKAPAGKPRPRPAILKPLGAQLRRLRLERDLSQEKLAELAGINSKYLGRVELAKADPGADVLVRLARALVVPVGEIFDTISPMGASPYRLTPADLDSMTSAVVGLRTVVERIAAGQPPPTRSRARKPRPR